MLRIQDITLDRIRAPAIVMQRDQKLRVPFPDLSFDIHRERSHSIMGGLRILSVAPQCLGDTHVSEDPIWVAAETPITDPKDDLSPPSFRHDFYEPPSMCRKHAERRLYAGRLVTVWREIRHTWAEIIDLQPYG